LDKKLLYLKSLNHDVITVYISKDSRIQKTLDLLKREEPLVQNIKSRVTRQAIETAFQKIKSFLANPPFSQNGYIIVASGTDFAYTTEVQIEKDYYRCGNEFYAEPLEEIEALKLYPIGIITLDTQEATIAYIGSRIEILKHMTSGVPGKHSKGGQSQRRFEREREMEILNFFRRIGDAAKMLVESYLIEELIISGCGETKRKFMDAKYLDYRLKGKITEVIDTQYTGEHGIRETLHKVLPLLHKNAYAKEVEVVEKVLETLGKNFEMVVYGHDEIQRQLHLIRKIIKIEEVKDEYPGVETVILRFQGEHYDKIRGLGGIVGLK